MGALFKRLVDALCKATGVRVLGVWLVLLAILLPLLVIGAAFVLQLIIVTIVEVIAAAIPS